jgi:hypothetical protein
MYIHLPPLRIIGAQKNSQVCVPLTYVTIRILTEGLSSPRNPSFLFVDIFVAG